MEEKLTALFFMLFSFSILIFGHLSFRITKLIYTIQDIFGLREKPNRKLTAIENTITAGELILITGLAIAFLHMPEVAGFLIFAGFVMVVVPLGYLWYLEIFSEFQNLKKSKEENKDV